MGNRVHITIGKTRSTPKFTKGMREFGNWPVTANVALSASHLLTPGG